MNKEGFLRVLFLSFILAITAVFVAGNAMAQVVPTQIMLTNALSVPLDAAGKVLPANDIEPESDPLVANDNPAVATVLVDNFEYWNNPRNMGWNVVEPPYPVWGYGLGYAQVNNVLDFEEGSRVLDVYRPMSVFLMGTGYDVLQISKGCAILDKHDDPRSIPGANALMSVEVRAPLAIEQFDQFSIIVNVKANSSTNGTTNEDQDVTIVFRPMEGPMGATGLFNRLEEDDAIDDDDPATSTIMVALGRMFQDGTWHLVMENLADIIAAFDAGDPDSESDDAELVAIEGIMITGNQYRLDNIMFSKPSYSLAENNQVHLFHVGPVFCQLYGQQGYNPQGRWILCEDFDLGITAEYNEDGDLVFPNIANTDNSEAFFIDKDGNPSVTEPSKLQICDELDPNDRPDLSTARITAVPTITWTLTMGGALGPQINDRFTERATIDGGDGTIDGEDMNTWPPYLMQEATDDPRKDCLLVVNSREEDPNVVEANDTVYKMDLSNPMYALASALLNSGYSVIPNAIRIVPHGGQVFEDMIVTCRASDGAHMDEEVFPVSVVNYPVTNHPPIINDLNDQFFYVGMQNVYRVTAHDPDMQDMGKLTFHATLNGLQSYQYGPWSQNIIEPCGPNAGVISFVPQFETTLNCILTVQDPRGMFAVVEFVIYCVNQGTWFNHPPVVLADINTPITVRAGERYVDNRMEFSDPDGDKLYYSCNFGSVGNNGVYTFQTTFPGRYYVQITAYDIRGGYCTWDFMINVIPWWSL